MRIVQIAPYFLPYLGGQERYVFGLSRYLSRLGNEVYVITSDYPNLKSAEVIDGIFVKRIKTLARILRNPITRGLDKEAKKIIESSCIVNLHNEHSFLSLYYSLFYKRRPTVLTNHGILRFGVALNDLIERFYFFSLSQKIMKNVDALAVNSESDRIYLTAHFKFLKGKIKVLHNAIDTEYWDKINEKPVSIDENNINLLFVGRLIKRKGIIYLIEGLYRVIKRDKEKKVHLNIVGRGEDEKIMFELVKKYNLSKYVTFFGSISDNELKFLYKNSDIFILPSISEGCSTSILEAFYFRLPVIVSDISSNKEHFQDYAIFFKSGNVESLYNKICDTLNNLDKIRKKVKKAREYVKKEFSWNSMSRRYLKFYIQVLDEYT